MLGVRRQTPVCRKREEDAGIRCFFALSDWASCGRNPSKIWGGQQNVFQYPAFGRNEWKLRS
jgi:hypothetical protein